jgi:hypothetical protein
MADAEQLPGDLNIDLVQGDDFTMQLSADVNYSGFSFITTVHPLHGTTPVTAQTVLSAGTSTSTVQVTLTAAQTAALAVTNDEGAHNWKIVYTDTSNLTRTWVKGELTVLTGI